MLRHNNSVAVLALIAFASTEVPRAAAQDPPAASPAQGLESLVDSLSPDTDEGAAIAGDNLPDEVLFTDEELDGLVAPVALYPDALLAQVLVASTYPMQIIKADRVIAESADLSDEAFSETLADQDFDPSVLVLLSGFPTVVQRMADDIEWTEQLGIAMLQQDDDVLAAVQRMRADARDMGYLSSNDAQTVEEDDGQIYIEPSQPDVVYVPTYDPSLVYTSPAPAEPYYVAPAQSYYSAPPESYYVPPTQTQSPFSAQNLLTTGVIAFGSALLVNELWGDDDDDDNDDDDWDNYWRRPRPIAWEDREFYPRPYWNRDRADQARAWSWERDNYWRRSDNRWRREAARDRREYERDRFEALGALRNPQRVRAVRESAQWRALEEQRRERQAIRARQERREQALRDQRQELRQEAEAAERRQERRQEAAATERRQERRQEAAATERRQERRQETEAAARRQERPQQQRREERAQARQVEERRAIRARQERREQASKDQRQELRQEAEAAERRRERGDDAAASARRQERLQQQRREERAQAEPAEERRTVRAREARHAERDATARRQDRRKEVKSAAPRSERVDGQTREERSKAQRTQEQQRAWADAERREDRQAAKHRQVDRAEAERRAQREKAAQHDETAKRRQADERAAAQSRRQKAPQAEPRRKANANTGPDDKRRGEQARQNQGGDNKRCRADDERKGCK